MGEAAVYFQVHTGRMPLVRQEADAQDKPRVFSDEEIDQLMAYVQANGGGPTLPSGDLRAGDVALGGELFRLNCASCHNFVGEGGALSSGKAAPSLLDADDLTIYTAMLSGPENMPVFGDNQLHGPARDAAPSSDAASATPPACWPRSCSPVSATRSSPRPTRPTTAPRVRPARSRRAAVRDAFEILAVAGDAADLVQLAARR